METSASFEARSAPLPYPTPMLILLSALLSTLGSMFRSRAVLELEHMALRHQIGVLKRSAGKRPRLTPADRLFWVFLSRAWCDWRSERCRRWLCRDTSDTFNSASQPRDSRYPSPNGSSTRGENKVARGLPYLSLRWLTQQHQFFVPRTKNLAAPSEVCQPFVAARHHAKATVDLLFRNIEQLEIELVQSDEFVVQFHSQQLANTGFRIHVCVPIVGACILADILKLDRKDRAHIVLCGY